jgi:hypothetical protein
MSRFLGYWEKTREGGLLLFRCVVLLLSCVNFCLVHFLSRFNFFLAPRGRLALFLPPRGRRDIDIFASVEGWEYNYIHPYTILYLRAAFPPDSPHFHAVRKMAHDDSRTFGESERRPMPENKAKREYRVKAKMRTQYK